MKRTVKVSLDAEKSLGFGVLVKCCGKHQQINYDLLIPGEWWECSECQKPLILVTESGWYPIGNKIVI